MEQGEFTILKEMLDELRADIKDMQKWINGNGKPGFKVRFDRVERFVDIMLHIIKWGSGILAVLIGGVGVAYFARLLA